MSGRGGTAADRVGLGWRPELAAAILARRHRLDVIEVLADDYFDADTSRLRALRALSAEVPVWLHGVGMGLASPERAGERRFAKMARLCERIDPVGWSEHLAFVRAGGVELGHLAAPPRNDETLAGLTRNLLRAAEVVGTLPACENVASLVAPPRSNRSEAAWLCDVAAATGAPLLLDLHNLYANARNFAFDARAALAELPAERIRVVHLAGGRVVRGGRILDDHLHPVPEEVFTLLEGLAERAPGPLDIIVERDGCYPEVDELFAELDAARAALALGRARARRVSASEPRSIGSPNGHGKGGGCALVAFLARLYTDPSLRARFLGDARGEAARAGLEADDVDGLVAVSKEDLILAAEGFARKRLARDRLQRSCGRGR